MQSDCVGCPEALEEWARKKKELKQAKKKGALSRKSLTPAKASQKAASPVSQSRQSQADNEEVPTSQPTKKRGRPPKALSNNTGKKGGKGKRRLKERAPIGDDIVIEDSTNNSNNSNNNNDDNNTIPLGCAMHPYLRAPIEVHSVHGIRDNGLLLLIEWGPGMSEVTHEILFFVIEF
jgi:hypothetical protein